MSWPRRPLSAAAVRLDWIKDCAGSTSVDPYLMGLLAFSISRMQVKKVRWGFY